MYYNIHTNKIEDPLGNGFDDLNNKFIWFNRDIENMLFEDPLRLIWLVWFMARFDF